VQPEVAFLLQRAQRTSEHAQSTSDSVTRIGDSTRALLERIKTNDQRCERQICRSQVILRGYSSRLL
jgi:hypothetical protein